MLRSWCVLAALWVGATQAEDLVIPEPPSVVAKSHYLVDFASGRVLAASAAEERVEPASVTKLMTAYAVFKALEEKRISLDDEVLVSEKAWRTGGTRMFIEVGSHVRVVDLIRGMLIQSGNDASVALAEHVSGSVAAFVEAMNGYAVALGMTETAYRNPTGLPARDHYTSARDMATLAKALVAEFPEFYPLYAEREYTYNGIKQYNRNALLRRDASVDGMKTGHTAGAGYCIVTSAERDGMRLIAVIMGADTAKARDGAAQKLLNYGFENYETHRIFAASELLGVAEIDGQHAGVPLGLTQDVFVTIPRGRYAALSATMDLRVDLVAPLEQGTPVGEVKVLFADAPLLNMPLVALEQVLEGRTDGVWAKVRDGLGGLLQ